MPKFYFARHEWRSVTKYYEVEAEEDDAAWDQFLDNKAQEIGFSMSGRVKPSEAQDEYIGTNKPVTDYPQD